MAKKSLDTDTSELALALVLLIRRVQSETPLENNEFSWTQLAVIKRLDKEGPLNSADLARAERIKPQSMGTVIKDLEDLGLVERKAHPTDGRQFYIHLTAKGLAMRKATRAAKHAWFASAVAQLSDREQATLFAAGEIIKRLVDL